MFLNHQDDAIGAAPEVHKNVFENESIRVLDVMVPLGHTTAMHWHPKNMGYVLTGGTLRFTFADGASKEVTVTENQVTQGEGSHVVENIGTTVVRVLQIEFKE